MRILVFLSSLILFFSCCLNNPIIKIDSNEEWSRHSSELEKSIEFHMFFDQQKYNKKDTINIDLTFKNISNDTINLLPEATKTINFSYHDRYDRFTMNTMLIPEELLWLNVKTNTKNQKTLYPGDSLTIQYKYFADIYDQLFPFG
ncbi:hypothetical protein GF406_06915, partial [candidate division KSB1 bacterium]|nr:hypothetical protein [candidate division KSB1 bacterium]